VKQVIVVGAGPVGLLLANLLGDRGIGALLLERNLSPSMHSQAIGVMPPSLDILKRIGLVDSFLRRGIAIQSAVVHGDSASLGNIDFCGLPTPFPYVLSIPQSETERILAEGLSRYPSVEFLRGWEVFGTLQGRDWMGVLARDRRSGQTSRFESSFLCGCDGAHSTVRQLLGLGRRLRSYRDTFLMADYSDRSVLGPEAHLYFTRHGSVESFPLPRNRRRWIIQTERLQKEADHGYHARETLRRTGITLDPSDKKWESAFQPERSESRRFVVGSVALCGDAAHTMSPIGGQGMNTGFADADRLAALLPEILEGSPRPRRLLRCYQRLRRRATRSASRRAWISMRIGTVRGLLPSALRNLLVRLLVRWPFRQAVIRHFTMLTITGEIPLSAPECQPYQGEKK
jgi:2-polyprenyl-6-methoxyphenol hydroxylase-like FAD-dependent oxidoreductase